MKAELDRALHDCMTRMEAGEAESVCLARYPDLADELAPMLVGARYLSTLRSARLQPADQMAARAALGRAAAARRSPAPQATRWSFWGLRYGRALGGIAAALLLVVATAGLVAASRPGDAPYGLRIAVERAATWLVPAGEERAQAQLLIAERRLEDLRRAQQAGHGEAAALSALLQADKAAITEAAAASVDFRRATVARIEAHSRRLSEMAGTSAGSEGAHQLSAAAQRMLGLIQELEPGEPGRSHSPDIVSTPTPAGREAEPSPSGTSQPEPTPALQRERKRDGALATAQPTVRRSSTPSSRPTSSAPTATRLATGTPGPRHTASATPGPRGTSSGSTTVTPGSTATTGGGTPGTPQGPVGPAETATPRGGGEPRGTPEGPQGPATTPEPGGDPEGTPQGPQGPAETSEPGTGGGEGSGSGSGGDAGGDGGTGNGGSGP